MRDLRDNKLLRRLGYVSEAAAYNGETDGPDSRRYVSAIDDDGGAVYAVRRSGVPVLLVHGAAFGHYARAGHSWVPLVTTGRVEVGAQRWLSGDHGDYVVPITLSAIRRRLPQLLDQNSGVALFNVADALRLLAKYDAKRAQRRKGA